MSSKIEEKAFSVHSNTQILGGYAMLSDTKKEKEVEEEKLSREN